MSRWSGVSLIHRNKLPTSRPCRTCGIWRTTRQADKPAADCRSTNHVSAWKLRHCLRKRMAASGTCLQVLTASNLIYAVHNEPVLWNSCIEATEEEKELTWARIADIFGLNKHVAAIIMTSSSSCIFNSRKIYIYFRKVCLQTYGRCEISTHDKFPSYFYNERTSCRQQVREEVTRKLTTYIAGKRYKIYY